MQLEKINIKGFHNIEDKTYLLNDINYFYGLNGAGKTTILNAIQLALLGYIPGTNKTKSDIFKHANSNIMSVTLDITGESDIVIKRSWMKTPKDIVASISITPDTLTEDDIFQLIGDLKLPVFDFNSFIDMTSNKLKDWFINFLPDVDVKIDWDKKLQDSLSSFKHILDEEFVRDTIQMHQGIEAESTIDKIQTYHKALKSLLSEKKAELTRIQSTIQELIFHDDLDEMTDIDSVKSEIADLKKKMDIKKQQVSAIEQNERILSSVKELSAKLTSQSVDSLEKEIYNCELQETSLTQELEKVCTTAEQLKKEQEELNTQYNKNQEILYGKGTCPYSNQICNIIAYTLPKLKATQTELMGKIMSISEKMNIQLNTVEGYNQDIRIIVETHKTTAENALIDLNSTKKQIADMKHLLNAEVTGLDSHIVGVDITAIEEQIQEKEALLLQLSENQAYEKLNESLTKDKYKLEQNIDILKTWIKLTDANGLQSEIMNKPFEQLADSLSFNVKQLFGVEYSAHFLLSEKSNSFSFGLVKETTTRNIYKEFDLLSSGEKCLYIFALLLTLIKNSKTKLPIILIDDLLDHLDETNIQNLFDSLCNISDIQIILAGVQQCKNTTFKKYIQEVH